MLPLDLFLFEHIVDISTIAASSTDSGTALTHSAITPVTLRLKSTAENGLSSVNTEHQTGRLNDNLAYPEKVAWDDCQWQIYPLQTLLNRNKLRVKLPVSAYRYTDYIQNIYIYMISLLTIFIHIYTYTGVCVYIYILHLHFTFRRYKMLLKLHLFILLWK